ncbi:MAG: ribose 5-phosphate isomerase B [Bacteroidota bacterium]
MKIVIGSDHGGFALKEQLKAFIQKDLGHECLDYGCYTDEACDYPDYAFLVAAAVANNLCTLGIMVDGAGIGSAMVANKVPGVRAAVCNEIYTARNSREHNNANVLTMGSMVVGPGLAKEIVRVWLSTEFAGGRHARRVSKIDEFERRLHGGGRMG